MDINITFDELLKYVSFKNVNGSNIDELIHNKELVDRVETFAKNNSSFNVLLEQLKRNYNNEGEIKRIKEGFDKQFNSKKDKTQEELISEKFEIPIENIETILFNDGRVFYKFNKDGKDYLIDQSDKNNTLDDEIDSVRLFSDINKDVDAFDYKRLHSNKELKFYSKEELFNNPELTSNLTFEQQKGLSKLMSMENVVSINPESLIGNTIDHKTVYAEFCKDDDQFNIIDNSKTNRDIVEHDEETKKDDDSELDSMFDEEEKDPMMNGYYQEHVEEYDKLSSDQKKVYQIKRSDNDGFVAFTMIIGEIYLIAMIILFICFILK